jgi:hypothetical protein
MQGFVFSKELARQFAYDLYDVIVRDIKECKAQEQGATTNTDNGSHEERDTKGAA